MHVKINPREKSHFSLPTASPFLAWGDVHARPRFTRSTIPEEKWGTTRSLAGLILAGNCKSPKTTSVKVLTLLVAAKPTLRGFDAL